MHIYIETCADSIMLVALISLIRCATLRMYGFRRSISSCQDEAGFKEPP